ncbi:hypothetical protein HY620_02905 [Candidatus Uhrbacteria bacterium]|nr:hypothetical protein [Candidatus Uhrbacteria bacterium]
MKAAAPRCCPTCQLQRRLAYRNERSLYSRSDSKNGSSIISIFSPDKLMPVYSQNEWWGDTWDASEYGSEYDFSKPFFKQFHELITRTPWPALFNLNATNSEYCNYTTDNKNCYLVFGGDYNENCSYSSFNMHSRDSLDMYFVEKVELCYQLTNSADCYRVAFSQYATNCSESLFLFACVNCVNCIGCINLKNKQYCILNQQYSKEEYERKLRELNLGNYADLKKFEEQFLELKKRVPTKYGSVNVAENSTGNDIMNVKNCINCFETYSAENCKNLFLAGWNLKDAQSTDHTGHGAELVYDSLGIFGGCSRIRHSYFCSGSYELWYSALCKASNNLFGCFGLRHKSFCILNKQYTEKEYNELVPKIIEHMKSLPYSGADDCTYTFGDYFPPELSPFCYNESVAQEYYPLTKEDVLTLGYRWKDREASEKNATLSSADIPADIKNTDDSILAHVIACEHAGSCPEQCTLAFKIVPQELEFYRKTNLPPPRFCPNCRHYQRMKRRNPIKLWKRSCNCSGATSHNNVYTNTVAHSHGSEACQIEFETTYAPERPEIVYCEPCYQSEIS